MGSAQTAEKEAEREPPSDDVRRAMDKAVKRPYRRQPKNTDEGGGTIRPVYGERRPVTYHIFESEMTSISSLNGEATRYFSFGSFFIGLIVAISVAYFFADKEVKVASYTFVHYSLPIIAAVAVICFGFGIWATVTKSNMIKQIRSETRTPTAS